MVKLKEKQKYHNLGELFLNTHVVGLVPLFQQSEHLLLFPVPLPHSKSHLGFTAWGLCPRHSISIFNLFYWSAIKSAHYTVHAISLYTTSLTNAVFALNRAHHNASWGRIHGRNWNKNQEFFSLLCKPILHTPSPLEQKWFETGLYCKHCIWYGMMHRYTKIDVYNFRQVTTHQLYQTSEVDAMFSISLFN